MIGDGSKPFAIIDREYAAVIIPKLTQTSAVPTTSTNRRAGMLIRARAPSPQMTPATSVARAWNSSAGSNGKNSSRIAVKMTRNAPDTQKTQRPNSARRLWKNVRSSSVPVPPDPMAIDTGGREVVATSRL